MPNKCHKLGQTEPITVCLKRITQPYLIFLCQILKSILPFEAPLTTGNNGKKKQYNKNEKDYFGYAHSTGGNATKTKNTRHNGNNQ